MAIFQKKKKLFGIVPYYNMNDVYYSFFSLQKFFSLNMSNYLFDIRLLLKMIEIFVVEKMEMAEKKIKIAANGKKMNEFF